MDKVETYRQIVKKVLNEFVEYISGSPSETETFLAADDQQNTYTVLDLGWQGKRRVCGMPILIRLVEDKVWVEADNTDYSFVDHLLTAGIPKEDIVLAFHHPTLRPHTEFAMA